ncbi:uncharacterized protein LOC135208243 [Macrobrachium nipponense]|uniref:uncharacterized protein LOC135208243 n=1 Tax=Macrobrachium nipponense TaxID=159736 RepID=UPI0030C85001
MNILKVFILLLTLSMMTEALTWPWSPRSQQSRRRPHRFWSPDSGRLRRQQQQNLLKTPVPKRQSSSAMSTLARVRAATQLDIPDEPEFFRYLCRTTDVCPYSWQWMEGNLLRAIVRLSLLK